MSSTLLSQPTHIGMQSSATLDHACVSPSGILEAAISSPHLFIPYTDHRIICLTLLLLSPSGKNAIELSCFNPFFPPHPYYPIGKDKYHFQLFSEQIAASISNYSSVYDIMVSDDYSFQLIYELFSSQLQKVADENFKFRSADKPKTRKITNSTISLICRENRVINHIISALRQQLPIPPSCQLSFRQLQWTFLHDSFHTTSFLAYLCLIRRSLNKLCFREQEAKLNHQSQSHETQAFNAVLKGASSTWLYPISYITPPRALSHPSQGILTDPDQIKTATVDYFTQLYARTPHESVTNKPWLNTPAIHQIRQTVTNDPFLWPKELTLSDLHFLLC
ncbi:hypothetical protein AMATHDRAFT_51508 [Amanita thiersii Skay4041]|uniref:Uncharacterized protein n=1 Tax=Amanita thiersii Skay4041 TaxID=703135 RepID=A0A2A9N733_9AGAR|nr:hypothetical protein AMATHDRAFT_51508 [Amanita thiersii Skay4041]